jgi:hypothetical protein
MSNTVTSDNAESFGSFGQFRKTAISRISEFTMPPGTTYQTPEGLRAEDEETRIAFDSQGGVYPIRESVFRETYAPHIPECRSCHHREHPGRVCNAGRGECQCEQPQAPEVGR